MRGFLRYVAVLSAVVVNAAVSHAAPKADSIVIVADARKYTGLRAWWANVYNESHLLAAVITVVVVPLLGFLLGKLTTLVLARLGVNLTSRRLAEH